MIRLDHIGVSYGQRRIIEDLDLEFQDRCITAIMGPNGCGKTTMLRCIGGLLHPTRGDVLLDERSISTFQPRNLAMKMAFVRQHQQTDFDFSAFEIVLMGRNPYQRRLQNESQADWDIVECCMRQTGTWDLRFSVPSQLSGGELQRVMIARALAQQTPYLLMDEPVSNLDIAHQFEVMRLLRQASDKTILIVIHDLNLALQFCDRLLLLHNGHALYHGPIAQGLTPENIRTVFGVDAHISDHRIVFDY